MMTFKSSERNHVIKDILSILVVTFRGEVTSVRNDTKGEAARGFEPSCGFRVRVVVDLSIVTPERLFEVDILLKPLDLSGVAITHIPGSCTNKNRVVELKHVVIVATVVIHTLS